MMEEIRYYVDYIFDQYVSTQELRELRDEILLDAEDRYQDCLSRGFAEADARKEVIDSLGDLKEMLDQIGAVRKKKDARMEPLRAVLDAGNDIAFFVSSFFDDDSEETGDVYENIHAVRISCRSADVEILEGKDEKAEVFISGCTECLHVRAEDDVLVIDETETKKLISRDPRVKIRVPENLRLFSAKNAAGDMDIEGLHAQEAEITLVSGDLSMKRCSADRISAETVSGDIELQDCTFHDAAVTSKSGDAAIASESCADCRVRTVSGDIEIRIDAPDHLEAETKSGDVHASMHDTRECMIRSAAGDISMIADAFEKLSAFSMSGDIRCRTGKDPVEVQLKSRVGSVHCAIPSAVSDRKLTIETVTGDITVR